MIFYNSRRFHQSLGYKTPMDVWSVGETAMDMPALDRIAARRHASLQSNNLSGLIFCRFK
jgi:hypothetical protein